MVWGGRQHQLPEGPGAPCGTKGDWVSVNVNRLSDS